MTLINIQRRDPRTTRRYRVAAILSHVPILGIPFAEYCHGRVLNYEIRQDKR